MLVIFFLWLCPRPRPRLVGGAWRFQSGEGALFFAALRVSIINLFKGWNVVLVAVVVLLAASATSFVISDEALVNEVSVISRARGVVVLYNRPRIEIRGFFRRILAPKCQRFGGLIGGILGMVGFLLSLSRGR